MCVVFLCDLLLYVDPVQTGQGCLSLKAYRLSEAAIEMCKENWDFSVDWYSDLSTTATLSFVHDLFVG